MSTSFFILTCVVVTAQALVAAPGYGQGNEQRKISLDFKNIPIRKVFSAIEAKADVVIMYENTGVLKDEKVSISVKDKKVADVLDVLLKDKPLKWDIRENVIRVEERQPTAGFELVVPSLSARDTIKKDTAQVYPVFTGKVMDAAGTPIAGATVMVKGTRQGTNADEKGNFTLRRISNDQVLLISSVGYETKELRVTGKSIFVLLKIADNKLDEVQILAYGGATTRRLSTGSISKVTSEEISRSPVGNVLLALAGRVTGMNITQASGLTGAEVYFQVRGQNSLNANKYTSAPLVIIDGIPYPGTPVSFGNGSNYVARGSTIGYGSSLYNLNPDDIESVEILKDADATAVYGARAANGVMLITTKKGKQGKTRFDVNVNTGVSFNTRRVDLLTTPEYLALRREAFKNDGIVPTAANAIDLFKWDTTRNTNWQKELLGHIGQTTTVDISMSGGAGGTSFLVSGNYSSGNGTIYPDRRGSNKAGAHFSLTHTTGNGRFNIALSGLVNTTSTKLPGSSFGYYAFSVPPHWQVYDSLGNLNWEWNGTNPYASLKRAYSAKTFSLTSNLQLRYTILTGLDAKVSIGYTRAQSDNQDIVPKAVANPATYTVAFNMVSTSLNQTLNVEPQLQYMGHIGGVN